MSDLPEKYRDLSKYLSYILRHHPEEADLDLDKRGFADLDRVIRSFEGSKHSWASREDIEKLIQQSEKKRFEIRDTKIRALYGHSIDVIIERAEKPPDKLYHGTSPDSLDSIMDEGLKPMERQYVHLSISRDEALKVGKRHHPEPLILKIDALKAWKDDIEFYRRGDLYLSKNIPPKYIRLE